LTDDSERTQDSLKNHEALNKKTKMEAGNSLYGSGKSGFIYENGELT